MDKNIEEDKDEINDTPATPSNSSLKKRVRWGRKEDRELFKEIHLLSKR